MRAYIKIILQGLRRRFIAKKQLANGNRFYQRGQFPEAISAYRLSIEQGTSLAVVHYNLGLALYKTGARPEAREEWKIALKLSDGRNAYLHEQTAILLR